MGPLDKWWYGQLKQNLLSDVSIVPSYYHNMAAVWNHIFSLPLEPTPLATQLGVYGCPNPIMDTPPPSSSELIPLRRVPVIENKYKIAFFIGLMAVLPLRANIPPRISGGVGFVLQSS